MTFRLAVCCDGFGSIRRELGGLEIAFATMKCCFRLSEGTAVTEIDLAVIGLGYVGLPLAREAAAVGLRVIGAGRRPAQVDGAQRRTLPRRRPLRRRSRSAAGAGFTRHAPTTPCWPAQRRRHLRAHPAGRRGRTRPRRRRGAPGLGRRAPDAGHAGRARVHDLPGHHRRGRPPDPGAESGLVAGATSTWPSRPERDRPGQPDVRAAQHARRSSAGYTRPAATARRPSTAVRRHGRAGQRHPRGRDGQAAREHLPARQHRPGQRDGDASADELGIDLWDVIRLRGDQAVRLPGVLPRSRRRRPLHPDRPELPVLHACGRARLPVPVRRAGPGDQRADAGLRRRVGCRTCSTTHGKAAATAPRCCCSA